LAGIGRDQLQVASLALAAASKAVTVNAIQRPSGEAAGWATRCMRQRSSAVIARVPAQVGAVENSERTSSVRVLRGFRRERVESIIGA
jgi:hypothetical protein